MSNDAAEISIITVFERGWLASVFEHVCEDLMVKQGRSRTISQLLPIVPRETFLKVNQKLGEGRYPPTSPEDIVGIILDGNAFRRDYVINETVRHAKALKEILPPHLKSLTGMDFRIK